MERCGASTRSRRATCTNCIRYLPANALSGNVAVAACGVDFGAHYWFPANCCAGMIGAEEAGSGAGGADFSRTSPAATARATAAAEAAAGTAPPDRGSVGVVQPGHRGGGGSVVPYFDTTEYEWRQK